MMIQHEYTIQEALDHALKCLEIERELVVRLQKIRQEEKELFARLQKMKEARLELESLH